MNTHTAIGIDFGSSRFVIGVAKKGGVEVIVNEASYRQTPALVTFGSERRVGDRAFAHVKKELKNAIFFPTRLLGDVNASVLQQEEPFNYSRIKIREDARAQFHVNYEGEQIAVTAEQAVAALFTEITDVLALNGIENKEAVVSVPAYFNQVQRQALIDAAKIAGIDVVKLYNESSATVMNYGIFRKADLSATTPRTVAFVDFGHSKASVYVANIWSDRAEVLFEETDSNAGVRNIDLALLLFYLDKFNAKHKIDLSDNPKALYRLMEAIEKQRKILTANTEAGLSIECLYEDIDFSFMMTRDEFEKIASKTLISLEKVLSKCAAWLQAHSNEKLHSVERIGGGTRIHYVEHLIEKVFKIKGISKTLDANESVARGCAIQAAILSPLFKVAAFNVTDKILYPITIKLQYEGEEIKTKTLFDTGAEFNKTLSVSINKPSRLSIGLYVPSSAHNQPERQIIDAFIEKMNPKESKFEAKVIFFLNKNGMALIEKAELRENYIAEEKIPVKKTAKPEEKKGTDDTKVEIESAPEEEFTIEKKEKVRVTSIPIQSNLLYVLQAEQLQSMSHFENAIIQKERLVKETQRAKYLLESFIYNTRNKMSEGSNAVFTTAAEKEEILKVLQQAENWLYEEGANPDKETYTKNLTRLQDTAKHFYNRFKKIEDAKVYYSEAVPAFKEFESKHSELLAHGSPIQLNEVSQKISESSSMLEEIDNLIKNFSIPATDKFDFEARKSSINKNYEQMNNVLAMIKKDKENREREEKRKQEEEKKRQEEEAKKQAQTEANSKMDVEQGEQKPSDMEIENP